MKLEFRDKLQMNAVDLYFEIKDGLEHDITVVEADIKWSLVIHSKGWGIDAFNYELSHMIMLINIDTVTSDNSIENNKVYAEVKFNPKKDSGQYICRIYEEVLNDGDWIDEDYVKFPINFVVEERPSTETDNRSQIYVKYIELDLTSPEKKLKLTI